MKTARVIAAGVLSAGVALTGVVTATPALASGSWVCAPVVRSADGHSAAGSCYSGPGTKFALRATACTAGGCQVLTSTYVVYQGTAHLYAGSAYIDQNTFVYVHN